MEEIKLIKLKKIKNIDNVDEFFNKKYYPHFLVKKQI